jgi:hypothetical protein
LQKENTQHITTKTPPDHLSWLIKTDEVLKTEDGLVVEVWELKHEPDEILLSAWAKHFRNHYCQDPEIDSLRNPSKLSRAEYLLQVKFPDEKIKPGPSIRAGDFGEILIADFVEYILEFWVPRIRYDRKIIKDESTKGTDVLGFRMLGNEHSPEDILIAFEVKANTSKKKYNNELQKAVKGSNTDVLRRTGEALHAAATRFHYDKKEKEFDIVSRFQDPIGKPYKNQYGAAAVILTNSYDKGTLSITETISHNKRDALSLVIIKGEKLMELIHKLYNKAASEA